MNSAFDRRRLLSGLGAAAFALGAIRPGRAQTADSYGFPISEPDGLPGDGFLIRHGFQTENTWYNPGYWHTAEDWYRLDGAETAGAPILAIGPGDVVFAGSDYPGRVVIVQHRPNLYSMYGHLDYETLAVSAGDHVVRGQQLGQVLQRTDSVPSHLHFETRTFLYENEVNGDTPRYGFACGYQCAPGPGYWPIDAPEFPSAMGWRNPTHVIGNRLLLDGPLIVQATRDASGSIPLLDAPWPPSDTAPLGTIALTPGARYPVRAVDAGPEASTGTSAEAYRLSWLLDDGAGVAGWVRAAVANDGDTGSNGRPSSVRFTLLPLPNFPEWPRIKRNSGTLSAHDMYVRGIDMSLCQLDTAYERNEHDASNVQM